MIRVVLVDDQSLIRAGFRALLNAEPDVAIDGEDALRTTRETVPDVVLMDIRMPGRHGLAATRDIVADRALGGVRIIVLTTFAEDAYIFEAIRSGASGFLVKDTEPAELVHALRVVHGGDALLSPTVTRRLLEEFATRTRRPAHRPVRRRDTADQRVNPGTQNVAHHEKEQQLRADHSFKLGRNLTARSRTPAPSSHS